MTSQSRPGRLRSSELFGEMGAVSLMVLVCCLPLVTWVAAVAAGVAHMRRDLAGLGSGTGDFVGLFIRALRGAWALGAVWLGLTLMLGSNIRLLHTGVVPGGQPALALSVALLVLAWTVCLRAAASWSSLDGESTHATSVGEWFRLLREAAVASWQDPSGTALLASAGFVGLVLVWMFLPMFVLVPGLWVLAAVGVGFRRGRTAHH